VRVDEVEATLAKVTYKGKYKFTLERSTIHELWGKNDHIRYLAIALWVKDVEDHNKESFITSSVVVEMDGLTHELLMHKLFNAVLSLEMHEVEEWLRYDGIPIVNPHPEVKRK
jgi:hypothetical protein